MINLQIKMDEAKWKETLLNLILSSFHRFFLHKQFYYINISGKSSFKSSFELRAESRFIHQSYSRIRSRYHLQI